MMINFVNCIAILTFLIFILKIISLSTQKTDKCVVFKDKHGTMVADCNANGIKSIPDNLDGDIQVLDISNNHEILTLSNDDLKGYKKLWGLIMANLLLTSFPKGFFQNTPMLTMLNISNTQIKNLIEVPTSVTVLNFSFSNSEDVNLSHLGNLEELFLRSSSNMKTVPLMNKSAPLQILDMTFASLIKGNYTQIAPFCRLRFFGLRSDALNRDEHTERCCGFRKWCHQHSVIKYGWQRQNCSLRQGKTCEQIDINFSEEALAAFYECEAFSRRAFLVKIIVIVIITLMILVVPSLFLLHHYYKKKMPSVRETKESVPSEETVPSEDEEEADAD